MSNIKEESACPCQSGLLFKHCCQRFIEKPAEYIPETAEQLMRSRYCAYVVHNTDYLLYSWHPDYRPAQLDLDYPDNYWSGLKIKATMQGQKNDNNGIVHFIARYKVNGKAFKLEENSLFKKINLRWFYTEGSKN